MAGTTKDVQIRLEFQDDGSGKLKKVTSEMVGDLQKAGDTANKAGQGFDKLKQKTGEAGGAFSKFQQSFVSGMMQMAAGLGLWTSMAAIISTVTSNLKDIMVRGREFEEQFDKVEVVLKGNAEEVDRVQTAILKMSPTLGSSADNAKALALAMREFRDVPVDTLLKLTEVAARMAAAGFTQTSVAMEAVSHAVKGYNLSLNDAGKVGDVLIRATQLEDVSFEQLSRSVMKLSASAHQAGVSMPEMIAAYLQLAHTQDPQMAMMQMRMILNSLIKTSGQTKIAAADLGIEWGREGIKSQGFVGMLKNLDKAIGGNADKLEKLIPGSRQMIGFMNLIADNAAHVTANVEELTKAWNEGGIALAAFYKHFGELSWAMDTAKNLFDKLKQSIWTGFSDALKNAVKDPKALQDAVDQLASDVVDKGKSIGEAIFNAFNWIKTNKDTIAGAINDIRVAAIGLGVAWATWTAPLAAIPILLLAVTENLRQVCNDIDRAEASALKADRANITLQNNLYKLVTSGKMTVDQFYKLQDQFKGDALAMEAFIESGKAGPDMYKAWMSILVDLMAKQNGVLSTEEKQRAVWDQKKKDLDVLKAKMKEYGYSFKTELQDRYEKLTDILKEFGSEMTTQDYDKLKKELKELGANLGYYQKTLADLNLLTKDEVNVEIGKQQKHLADLNADVEHGVISWGEYEKGIKQVGETLHKLDPTISVVAGKITQLVDTKLPPGRALNFDQILKAVPGIQAAADEVNVFSGAVGGMSISMSYAAQISKDLGVELNTMTESDLQRLVGELIIAKDSGMLFGTKLAEAAQNIIKHFDEMHEKVPQWLKDLANQAGKTAQNINEDFATGFAGLAGALGTLAGEASGAFQPLLKAAQVATSNIGKVFQDAVKPGGKMDWSKIDWSAVAGQIGSGLAQAITGHASKFAEIGGQIGNIIGLAIGGPVGGAIGSFLGSLIGGLFGHKKTAAEILQEQINNLKTAYKTLGDITDATAKKIIDLTKQFNAQTAAAMTLADVIKDVGVTSSNASQLINKMNMILNDMKNGAVSAQNGIQALNDSFTAMMNDIVAQGQEGSRFMVSFINHVRDLGIHIAAVDSYVLGWLDKGASGIKAMTDALTTPDYTKLNDLQTTITTLKTDIDNLSKSSLTNRSDQLKLVQEQNDLAKLQTQYKALQTTVGSELAPEMQRVGDLTVAMFNSMVAQGMTVSDAFAKLKDPIDALEVKYEELGITGDAAIQNLLQIDKVEKANTGLIEAIGGSQQVLEALGNTGFLTADAFKTSAQEATSFYDKLIKGGMTSQQALATMAPTLEDLAWYSKQYKISIDSGTQALIDQAKQAGIWKDKGEDFITTLKDGFDAILAKLDKMIDKIGGRGRRGSLAGAIDDTANAMSDYGKAVQNASAYTGEEGAGGAPVTYAQHGFTGNVVGPHMFYIEPGVREHVNIGKNEGIQPATPVGVGANVTMEPIVLPWKDMEAWIIKVVQKNINAEQIVLAPRAVRGRG